MPKTAQEQYNHTAFAGAESAVRVFVEHGRLRIVGEIPVASDRAELEAFVSEINVKLLGDGRKPKHASFALVTKELTEAEAAIYIGHSRSFLIGYSVGIWQYEAAAVGAWHRRMRVFFVAYSERGGIGDRPCAPGADPRRQRLPLSHPLRKVLQPA